VSFFNFFHGFSKNIICKLEKTDQKLHNTSELAIKAKVIFSSSEKLKAFLSNSLIFLLEKKVLSIFKKILLNSFHKVAAWGREKKELFTITVKPELTTTFE